MTPVTRDRAFSYLSSVIFPFLTRLCKLALILSIPAFRNFSFTSLSITG
uniref:Uncharacterized protein n=1 Tax=Arundo donax TaxID=35708 RepID=A0A0A9DXY8_ARUDO